MLCENCLWVCICTMYTMYFISYKIWLDYCDYCYDVCLNTRTHNSSFGLNNSTNWFECSQKLVNGKEFSLALFIYKASGIGPNNHSSSTCIHWQFFPAPGGSEILSLYITIIMVLNSHACKRIFDKQPNNLTLASCRCIWITRIEYGNKKRKFQTWNICWMFSKGFVS